MDVSDFDYELPERLIAQRPAKDRTGSRLLVLERATGHVAHRMFSDLPEYLGKDDLLVVNDSRVVPARVIGKKETGGRAELLFLPHGVQGKQEGEAGEGTANDETERILSGGTGDEATDGVQEKTKPEPNQYFVFRCLMTGKNLRPGVRILLPGGVEAVITGKDDEGFSIRTEIPGDLAGGLEAYLSRWGSAPLPPYIRRGDAAIDGWSDADDQNRYQTVYADPPGSVAAPTAGLHFDEVMLARLDGMGIGRVTVTLHVGPGTFLPVRTERVEDHRMHAEVFDISEAAADKINAALDAGRRIVAVGTTTVRALEGVATPDGRVPAGSGGTRLFITPGFGFRITGAMVTNFHLPRSTLLMLTAAFAGRDKILEAYREAVKEEYRFYSYGDAMLIV
ncbi:MAG: tRNA preQ1(34) S-adenosylmethionine ribosyltransferase-isomerase QueA [Deltaproteobacteria bacterium]|nr:tRNA preQ1(34) S-adenosylmethionine ribosyltransferase-isomerase QueA [Candidatus Zymogenaceae bacterium]